MYAEEKQLCELQAIARMLEEATVRLDACDQHLVAAHVQAGLDILRNGDGRELPID